MDRLLHGRPCGSGLAGGLSRAASWRPGMGISRGATCHISAVSVEHSSFSLEPSALLPAHSASTSIGAQILILRVSAATTGRYTMPIRDTLESLQSIARVPPDTLRRSGALQHAAVSGVWHAHSTHLVTNSLRCSISALALSGESASAKRRRIGSVPEKRTKAQLSLPR